jgi:hypothetical protein
MSDKECFSTGKILAIALLVVALDKAANNHHKRKMQRQFCDISENLAKLSLEMNGIKWEYHNE